MVVLVVEDSSTMRQLICMALRKIEGIEIVEAGDGKDALVKLAGINPDLVMTDLNMPEMDGFALIEELRSRPDLAKLPILVLTTAGALHDQERAKSLGVTGYVTKPIRPDEIVNAVRQVIGLQG